jgi:hypothetical protein
MKLEILILTQPSRSAMLSQLMSVLWPQMRGNVTGHVEQFDPSLSLGENRERMRRAATAEYICFVDDDDLIPPYYVARILNALAYKPDIVGWEQVVYVDGVAQPQRDIHSISTVGWLNTPTAYYRDFSHLQPIRRDLALAVAMEGGVGEDARWADGMRAAGVVKRETFIPLPPMYYYLSRSKKDDATDAQAPARRAIFDTIRRLTL